MASLLSRETLPHPGKYDEIQNDARNWSEMPRWIGEVRLETTKVVTPYYQFAVGFILSNQRDKRVFHPIEGPTYAQLQYQKQTKEFLQLMYDSVGNFSSHAKINVSDTTSFSLAAQRQFVYMPTEMIPGRLSSKEMKIVVVEADKKLDDSNVCYRSVLRENGPTAHTLSFLQSISPNVALGVQTEFQLSSPFASSWTWVGRWKNQNTTRFFSLNFPEFAVASSYKVRDLDKDKKNKESALFSEISLETDFQLVPTPTSLQTTLSVGFETKSKAKMGEFKMLFNSLYQLKLCLQQLVPFFGNQVQLGFACILDFWKNDYRFGLNYNLTLLSKSDLVSPSELPS
jgi:hypothetical protein